MLWTLAVIFLCLWALGLITGYTMGGFVHLLILIAIIVVLVRVISGRRAI
ncbi:lmo0937 family membrane protein [bacterium]|nr:lmo0937 family membrane protein [bacterium]